ncbi:hypothetical protein NSQ82_01275 [Caldifermentibacillus hisashii]|uniref:hypothetical protein n=1 Tax=Caldifermentibacillus hisashii TaxID=996558 RepID=UPI0031B6F8FA
MDERIQELIDFTKAKFGLDDYYLERHGISRNVNIFNETIYTFDMEWFPKHIAKPDDDSNPEGTAVIEFNLHAGKFERAIFVMGKTYAKDGIAFPNMDSNDIIKWIEEETGLIYGNQFQLRRQKEREFYFGGCIDGVDVSPAGLIEVKLDSDGKLTMFSVLGPFPSKNMVIEETYHLSFEKIEHLAKEQLKLIEFPSDEQKKIIPVYGVEEIFVTNDGRSTIPIELDDPFYVKIDEIIFWDEPINETFERKEIRWIEDIKAEQAFSNEPSPDLFPITKEEQDRCVQAVKDFLRQVYPNDTGKWMLKTLKRNKGYIHAKVRANYRDYRVFQRKLEIIIDANRFQVVNYLDTEMMLQTFDQFQKPDKVTVTKEEAFEKIKELFELKPVYVYDFEQKQYVLCGKLDCQYGVHAASGEVILLDELI